ncbi:uncharacterized protein LOC108682345 [Hyalella azteca]|uniref:Uncharacterized protein LOC108682345 n=1 Tax=Hyalella azteca TaxID=294128 RepID=A0A979FQ97_HYAAZ|nr:uncharacterized protein LOC108682345 [Hyalella azteca]
MINYDLNRKVSWIRSRDHHLITVGRQTYSSDNRFSVNFNRHLSQWTLHLRYVQPRDAGEYICQLSTDPPMVYVARLSVTAEASSVIAGGRERYVHEGSSVRLECVLQNHTQPPDYVFWYHNGTMINYDLNRKVSVEATTDGSVLTLLSVGRTDSGNYTCSPANAQFASITLHIILGDTLAAMKVSGDHTICPSMAGVAFLLLLSIISNSLRSVVTGGGVPSGVVTGGGGAGVVISDGMSRIRIAEAEVVHESLTGRDDPELYKAEVETIRSSTWRRSRRSGALHGGGRDDPELYMAEVETIRSSAWRRLRRSGALHGGGRDDPELDMAEVETIRSSTWRGRDDPELYMAEVETIRSSTWWRSRRSGALHG